MDEPQLNLLRAELRSQLQQIERVSEILEERAAHAAPDAPAYLESEAYQLHNFYSAAEDLLQIVATAFENAIADPSRWHSQLIHRLTLEIEGVRPALLSEETARLLQELRAFRQFFRHAYGTQLDHERVDQNLRRAREVRPLLTRDVEHFLADIAGRSPSA